LPGASVDVDAAEDVGQGDQHDQFVDRGHQHAERGVRQDDPLVMVGLLLAARHVLSVTR
jgi:hypothetical protein